MEFTVRCCDVCPPPEVMPDEDELIPTGVVGVYLLDEELVPYALTLADRDEEEQTRESLLCPVHVAALRWLLQIEEPAPV